MISSKLGSINKVRVILLSIVFLSCAFLPVMPDWIYDNFWYKADFWNQWGFKISYELFALIFAVVTTALFELCIRFIKRFA